MRSGKPRWGRNSLIALVIAAGLIGLVQRFAAATDYQYAFIATEIVAATAILFILSQLQRACRRAGHPWRVPAITLGLLATAALFIRIDGFTGETVPLLRWRFASDDVPPLVTRVTTTPDVHVSPSDRDSLAASTLSQSGSDHSQPSIDPARPRSGEPRYDSVGFLGEDRSGVFDQRSFTLPTSLDEVQTLWNVGIGDGWASFAVSGEVAVTLEQRQDQECVTAYRLADGELLWLRSHPTRHQSTLGAIGPRTTPSIEADRVYAQGATGRVWCLDLETGQPHWTANLLDLAGWDQAASEAAISWGRAGSPLLVDGLCVVPFGGPTLAASELAQAGRSLIAFDAQTGDIRWTAGEDQISYASPQLLTLGGMRQIVIVNEATITGHRIEDGQTFWSFPWLGQSNAAASCAAVVAAGENRFLVGKGYGGGSALVAVTRDEEGSFHADELWRSSRLLKTKFTHPCVDDGVAYAISNGTLQAVDVDEAERLWQQSRGDRCGQGQLILAGDTLIVQTEPGDVAFVAADPADYRELFRLPALSSKTWNIPTLAGRHLIVRNDREAICYLLPEKN